MDVLKEFAFTLTPEIGKKELSSTVVAKDEKEAMQRLLHIFNGRVHKIKMSQIDRQKAKIDLLKKDGKLTPQTRQLQTYSVKRKMT